MSEASRQEALLAALRSTDAVATDAASVRLRETGARAEQGLEAYRANARAIAERALASSFATVRSLIGPAGFAHLARGFWKAGLPARGDLGEWGGGFPHWLQSQPELGMWPYLADCATLDWLIHQNERAADAAFDAPSLSRLGSADPASLRIVLMPGTALLRSAWPVASIHAAHRLEGAEAERAFEAVRDAMHAKRGENSMVVRQGWRAAVHAIDAPTADWLRSLLDGASLATALEQAGEGFAFADWLAAALRESWLADVRVAADGDSAISRVA